MDTKFYELSRAFMEQISLCVRFGHSYKNGNATYSNNFTAFYFQNVLSSNLSIVSKNRNSFKSKINMYRELGFFLPMPLKTSRLHECLKP